ncbi:hypothetical protein O181_037309 [Austropuccinia psidii MF-1]|uniref:Uncharacterized protein n=1 Tax=Austropuccinia psidii MF-1 TaxID=1389203 RepID=A0A9Q3D6A3_9BASI|nr:hypothetical protein [Austropuccinia psidii MF-1]
MKAITLRMVARLAVLHPDLLQQPKYFTNLDSINAPSNPSSSNSNSNSQKASQEACKLQSLPNLNSIESNLDLDQLMINRTPIKCQLPSNDDSSIGTAFQPNYQNHPYQSLIASSSPNLLKKSSSSSINPNAHGNLQPQYHSINL